MDGGRHPRTQGRGGSVPEVLMSLGALRMIETGKSSRRANSVYDDKL